MTTISGNPRPKSPRTTTRSLLCGTARGADVRDGRTVRSRCARRVVERRDAGVDVAVARMIVPAARSAVDSSPVDDRTRARSWVTRVASERGRRARERGARPAGGGRAARAGAVRLSAEDARALNRAIASARSPSALRRVLDAVSDDALLNAINCACAIGSAAKMASFSAKKGSSDDSANEAAAAVRIVKDVADVARRGMELRPDEWWPRQIAAVLWACGKVNSRDREVEAACEQLCERRNRPWKPQELSNAFWGLAKVNSDAIELFRFLGERIRVSLLTDVGTDHRTGWTAQGVSNAAWSLGALATETRIGMFEESALGGELVRELARAIEERIELFNPQECANTLSGLAKCAASAEDAPRGAKAFAERLKRDRSWLSGGQFQCQHVSNVVWACAKLNMSDDAELVDVLVEAADTYATKFNAQELSTVLWGLATLAVSNHKIMQTLAKCMARKVEESSAQQMATSAHAMAKLGVYNSQLMKAYRESAALRREQFQPRDIAFLTWSFAKLEVYASEMFKMLSEVICDMLYDVEFQTFTPHHLTMVLWSFAMLKEDVTEILPSVTRAIKSMIDEFNPRDLTNTAWALAELGCDDEELIKALGTSAKSKLSEFNSQELLKFLGSHDRLGVDNESLVEAVSSQRTLTYEFPALQSSVELVAATPQSYKGTDRVRVDDSCGGWGRGNTGVALWEGSFVLAEWLSRQRTPLQTETMAKTLDGAWADDWKGKVCVELGAGLGLPSIIVSRLGARVIATDGA